MEDLALKKADARRNRRFTAREIEQIRTLVKNGWSLRRVSRETGVPYSTVHRYAAQFSKRQTRMNFSVFNERELGYFVGAFVGDGSRIVERKSGHYGAKFCFDAKRDLEIASFLRELFERSGKRVSLYGEETWLLLKVYSKKFLGFLSRFVEYVEYEGRKRKLLVGSEIWSGDFVPGFIGGLIDADGYIDRNKRRAGHFGAYITTMNYTFAKQLVSLFIRLGLKTKVNKIKPSRKAFSKKATYIVHVPKAEFNKVCQELICIKHKQSGCRTKSF